MTVGDAWISTHEWSFPASTTSIARARNVVAACLAGGAFTSCVDDVRLMVSELVTNAVVHASSRCEVTVRISERRLRVEVADGCRSRPQLRHPSPTQPNGRGLFIIDSLAESWGVEDHGGTGKTVWFQVRVPPQR